MRQPNKESAGEQIRKYMIKLLGDEVPAPQRNHSGNSCARNAVMTSDENQKLELLIASADAPDFLDTANSVLSSIEVTPGTFLLSLEFSVLWN